VSQKKNPSLGEQIPLPQLRPNQCKKSANVHRSKQVCREICAAKDYYKVLGVEKDASENDLKKAFKRRAVKVHPDKNPAPRATEAFKKVNAAMACLTDPQKRRQYD